MDKNDPRDTSRAADGDTALRRLHHHLLRIEDDSSAMKHRLEELDRNIAQARSRAMDHGLLPPDAAHRRPSFHDPNPADPHPDEGPGLVPG